MSVRLSPYIQLGCVLYSNFTIIFQTSDFEMAGFSEIPILDLSLARREETKPKFLEDLRHALLEVGFLYLKNIGIPEQLVHDVKREGIAFFDIPEEEK